MDLCSLTVMLRSFMSCPLILLNTACKTGRQLLLYVAGIAGLEIQMTGKANCLLESSTSCAAPLAV